MMKIVIVVIVSSVSGPISCAPVRTSAAEYCVAVSASGSEVEDVYLVMDKYAKSEGFVIDRAPTSHSYTKENSNVIISVDGYMGKAGTIITLFGSNADNSRYKKSLGNYISSNLSKKWSIRQCNSIDGFDSPIMKR